MSNLLAGWGRRFGYSIRRSAAPLPSGLDFAVAAEHEREGLRRPTPSDVRGVPSRHSPSADRQSLSWPAELAELTALAGLRRSRRPPGYSAVRASSGRGSRLRNLRCFRMDWTFLTIRSPSSSLTVTLGIGAKAT